jgi:hypothetical protein
MAITYSIDSGADAAKFNINATTGALTFKVAPDFEAPGDANRDNVYEVVIKATDATGLSSTKPMTVTVTDVSEGSPPQITSAGAISVKENQTTVLTVTATDPDDAIGGGGGAWSLSKVPFAATSSFNTPIPAGTTYTAVNWPVSTGYNYSVSWDAYSPAVYISSSSDPVVTVPIPSTWGWPAQTLQIKMPVNATGASGTDGEVVVIDGDTVHNFWQFKRTSNTTGTCQSYGATSVTTKSGWGQKNPFLGAGITAVGASQLAGLLVQAEIDADGTINHALQLCPDMPLVKPGFVGEAIAGDGGTASGLFQEGQRLGIPPNVTMPSGLSPLGQKVFTAMQKYGAFVMDKAGGVTTIRAQANAFDDATITALWHDMDKITPKLQLVP